MVSRDFFAHYDEHPLMLLKWISLAVKPLLRLKIFTAAFICIRVWTFDDASLRRLPDERDNYAVILNATVVLKLCCFLLVSV